MRVGPWKIVYVRRYHPPVRYCTLSRFANGFTLRLGQHAWHVIRS